MVMSTISGACTVAKHESYLTIYLYAIDLDLWGKIAKIFAGVSQGVFLCRKGYQVTFKYKQELSYRKQVARQLRTQYVEGIYRPKY